MRMFVTLAAGLVILASPQLRAADRSAAPSGSYASAPVTDFSARKKRTVVVVPAAPTPVAPGYHSWTGPDPSWGPGTSQLREYQREGRCVIDEGYGRYTFCSNM